MRNYTTQIAVEKTILEIESILVRFGARGVYKEYNGSRISALMFYLEYQGKKIPFKIPVSLEKSRAVIDNLVKERKLPQRFHQEPLRTEQGERVTWRIVKDWIDSQLSLLEMNFAQAIEIFLPYAYSPVENQTLYEKFINNTDKFLSLENKQTAKEEHANFIDADFEEQGHEQ